MLSKHIADASTLSGWRKSSFSSSQGGSCLEVLDGYAAGVPVRDSKTPTGPAVVFSDTHWGVFVHAVTRGTI
ncbi:DUF397 domain-containing protein [Streptomyces niveiscabiei]|uniref:DUF397 domain-containing protein n=1 Tax=Streptomyces niveiscabiei TaxID=164115 RepID=UPI00099F07D7|nr:DUF397 domain-containing protein [Streptomyces niveiscabiei]